MLDYKGRKHAYIVEQKIMYAGCCSVVLQTCFFNDKYFHKV